MRAQELRRLHETRASTAGVFGSETRSRVYYDALVARLADGGWADQYRPIADPARRPGESTEESVARHACGMMAQFATDADPYYVAGEMVDVLEMAALDVPVWDVAAPDLLTPTGFVLFDRPIRGLPLLVDDGEPAAFDEDGLDGFGWWQSAAPDGTQTVVTGPFWFDRGGPFSRHTVVPCSVPPFMPLVLGRPWDQAPERRMAILAAFWRLIQMPFVSRIVDDDVDRATRRMLNRARLPLTETIVVTLRKAKRRDVDGEPRPIDWSHRWLVRGHWANQWYPSEQRHAPVYRAPYVKGPEDKPFVPKHRIFDVRR